MKYILSALVCTLSILLVADDILVNEILIEPIETEEVVTEIVEPTIIIEEVGPTLTAQAAFANMVIDQRNLFYHVELFGTDTTILDKWIAIYRANYDPITKVVCPSNVRMIAEVRQPVNQEQEEILNTNLTHYKAAGYNAVLLAFSGTETPATLVELVTNIKNTYQLNVWYTFGPIESLSRGKVFIDPDKYTAILKALAPICSGYISGWKRTSAHMFYQDDKFMQFTATTIREANPNLPIVGEIFWGSTAFSDSKVTEYGMKKYRNKIRRWYQYESLVVRGVDNTSGWLISGFGTIGFNVESIMTKVLKDYPEPKLVVLTGPYVDWPLLLKEVPYNVITASIVKLRTRWFNAGAYGIVVPHAGMINETKHPEYTDNLSALPYTTFTNQ